MKPYNYFNDLIEKLHVEKQHRLWVVFTDSMLDLCIRILIVVAIGLFLIKLIK